MSEFGSVDVCLTSISSRKDTLCETLRSILAQDYSDVCVNLYISEEPYLLDDGIPSVPADVLALQKQVGNRLRVIYTRNTGPYRKLLPYLQENWGLSRLVVTADDDTIYPNTWLTDLLSAYRRFGCSIAFRGHRIVVDGERFAPYRSWMRSTIEENPSAMIVGTGKDGILYDTAFFPESVLNIESALQLSPTADDLWLRWNLSENGIPTYVINSDYRTPLDGHDYSSSLYLSFNQFGGNDAAISALDAYFQDSHDFDLKSLADPRAQQGQRQGRPLGNFTRGTESGRSFLSDESFDAVCAAADLPGHIELSDCWTLDLKALGSEAHGSVKREPEAGIRIDWQGALKFVRLWQNFELIGAEQGNSLDVQVTLRIQSEAKPTRIFHSVVIEEENAGNLVGHKLRLAPPYHGAGGMLTVRAQAKGVRLQSRKLRLRVQFDDEAKSVIVRSIRGTVSMSDSEVAARARLSSRQQVAK